MDHVFMRVVLMIITLSIGVIIPYPFQSLPLTMTQHLMLLIMVHVQHCVYGCTEITAFNYNEDANVDNDSCEEVKAEGCTDENAFNFNPDANTDYDGAFVLLLFMAALILLLKITILPLIQMMAHVITKLYCYK